jgi:hypothetical protein
VGCKSSSEAEMRRLNTNLRHLEQRRAGLVFGPDPEAERRRYDGPIAELQARYDHLAGVANSVPASITTEGHPE